MLAASRPAGSIMYNNYPTIDVIRSKMDQVMVPELSLGPSDNTSTSCDQYSCETARRCLKKRKSFNDHHILQTNKSVVMRRSTLDDVFLRDDEVKRDRLPLDWEQCLDLKSGKMYFLNRKTAEKSWDRPTTATDHDRHQNNNNNEKPLLELELNISISPTSTHSSDSITFKASTLLNEHKPTSAAQHCHPIKTSRTTGGIGSNNMVALACSNCHLLVILSKSSPSCPNCKYVHYLHDQQQDFKASPDPNLKPIVNTLTLFS